MNQESPIPRIQFSEYIPRLFWINRTRREKRNRLEGDRYPSEHPAGPRRVVAHQRGAVGRLEGDEKLADGAEWVDADHGEILSQGNRDLTRVVGPESRRGRQALAHSSYDHRDARASRHDLHRRAGRPEAPPVFGDSVAPSGVGGRIASDPSVAQRDAAGESVGQTVASRQLVLADGVAVEEVDAVEVGQEISLEERANRLVDPLIRRLQMEGAVGPGAPLETEHEPPAGIGVAAVLDGGYERKNGPGSCARFRDPVEAAHEDVGLVAQIVTRPQSRSDAVSARKIPSDDAALYLGARGDSHGGGGGEVSVGRRHQESPVGPDARGPDGSLAVPVGHRGRDAR